jgi:radical SAM peptide maturase (CXXX-repeat target family)
MTCQVILPENGMYIKNKDFPSWQDDFARLIRTPSSTPTMKVRNVTFVVTERCNLNCTYCYETHKSNKRMTKEVGRKAVDMLFETEKLRGYLETEESKGIILEFIGGEPLLEIDLIDYLVDYFKTKAFLMNHPWGKYYAISITSNGILYLDEKVQNFLNKNNGNVSLSITIDGNKDLHDSCRVFHDGRPSYDIVERSMIEHLKKFPNSSTKLTLSPYNVEHLSGALENLHKLGIRIVHGNLAFEEGWEREHAKVFYRELIKSADHILENKTYRTDYVSYFDEDLFVSNNDLDKNHCGGNGNMLAIGTDGKCYPCLRYMKHSLSTPGREEIEIGDIHKGIDSEDDNPWIPRLKSITMRTQSTDKCINCPISKGCTICNGYQYDKFGDPNVRATFICEMHQARSLANVYYWNKLYRELKIEKRMDMNIPKDWALKIIDQDTYNSLMALTEV